MGPRIKGQIEQHRRDERGHLPLPLAVPYGRAASKTKTKINKKINRPRGGHLQQGVDEVDEVVLHEGEGVARQALQDEARRLHHLRRAAFAFAAAFGFVRTLRAKRHGCQKDA